MKIMSPLEVFLHWFTPHHSNAHKPKLLHTNSLVVIIVGLIVIEGFLNITPRVIPQILGFAASIPPEKVIELTNKERLHHGLSPLNNSNSLNQAALAKAGNMFAKDYWAHNAPDGTQPWAFIKSSGYQYIRAGENLARDFTDPLAVVDAWMNSPSHKDNLLNPDYEDIGVAVVDGTLGGVQTTLVVQMFGRRTGARPQPTQTASKTEQQSIPIVIASPSPSPSFSPTLLVANVQVSKKSPEEPSQVSGPKPLFNSFAVSRSLTSTILTILIVALSLDVILVWKRRIIRLSGRSWAHLTFLLAMFIVLLIARVGDIL